MIPRRLTASCVVVLLLSAGVPADAQTVPAVSLSEVTVATHSDMITVFVKTSAAVKYRADLLNRPDRLVIDFEDTSYGWRRAPLGVSTAPVRQVRGSQYKATVARLVVELTRKIGYAIREDDQGLSIIIPTATQVRRTMPSTTAALATTTPVAPTTPADDRALQARPADTAAAKGQPATAATPAKPLLQVAQARPATPPARAVAPPPRAVPENKRLISLDFKEADVVNLLRILAAESGRNIVIGEDVKGKMSITLRNVPWDLALETILDSRGLVRTEREGVMRIVTAEQLTRERDARAKAEEAKARAETETLKQIAAQAAAEEARARGPLREETIRLSYADPEDVAKTLQGILGIPAEGTPAVTMPILPGPGVIPGPPFSQPYGPGQPPPPGAPMSPTIDVLAKGITIRAHKPTNSLFIRHYAADLQRIKKLIAEQLDIPLPQVKIEARMEILSRNDLFAIGVQWGGGGVAVDRRATLVGRGFTTDQPLGAGIAPVGIGTSVANPNLGLGNTLPVSGASGLPVGGNLVNLPITSLLSGISGGTAGLAFGIVGSRLNLNLALEALRTEGKTRTLARPEIVTVENGKASISLGEEIPYATISNGGTNIQFKEAVLKLEVTPTVVREGDINRIKMKVLVENNSRGATVNFGANGTPPAINKRRAETEVLIREGERLVIGGVTNAENQEAIRKVPLFGDIPILGWLFKQRGEQNTSTELVVFITPTIVRRDAPALSIPGAMTPR